MPRPRPPVDAEGNCKCVFHKRANYDGWARPEVVDPNGVQHPSKYVVRFAYWKREGAEKGWHVSWNDNSECWMGDDEVEDDLEAMRLLAKRAVDAAQAAEAARRATYEAERLAQAAREKRLRERGVVQAKTAAELARDRERRKAEEEAARNGVPILYDEDDLKELSSSAAAAIDGDKFSAQKAALLEKVDLTNTGVVHGYGVLAKVPLTRGSWLLDPTALMHAGNVDADAVGGSEFSEAYISTGNSSYFRIHWFAGDSIFRTAATFWINEARDREPNVEYRSRHDGSRMVSAWRIIKDIAPGEELLVVYSHAANEAEARAPSAEGWQDSGKYVGMYLRRDVESAKQATAKVIAYLPTTAPEPFMLDNEPRELWRVQYIDGALKGDTQDLEEEELETSEPSWAAPAYRKAPVDPAAAAAKAEKARLKALASKAKAPATEYEVRRVGEPAWRRFKTQTDAADAFEGLSVTKVSMLVNGNAWPALSAAFEARRVAPTLVVAPPAAFLPTVPVRPTSDNTPAVAPAPVDIRETVMPDEVLAIPEAELLAPL
jgi:hypothetical protein